MYIKVSWNSCRMKIKWCVWKKRRKTLNYSSELERLNRTINTSCFLFGLYFFKGNFSIILLLGWDWDWDGMELTLLRIHVASCLRIESSEGRKECVLCLFLGNNLISKAEDIQLLDLTPFISANDEMELDIELIIQFKLSWVFPFCYVNMANIYRVFRFLSGPIPH